MFPRVGASEFAEEDLEKDLSSAKTQNGTAGVSNSANGFTNPNFTDDDKIHSKGQATGAGAAVENGDTVIGLQENGDGECIAFL